jgi:hypothetical protein
VLFRDVWSERSCWGRLPEEFGVSIIIVAARGVEAELKPEVINISHRVSSRCALVLAVVCASLAMKLGIIFSTVGSAHYLT